MANSRSARKQIRASERKHERNRTARAAVRTYVGKARRALLVPGSEVNVEEALLAAVRALDRAAEKGIIHRNNAQRRKSRLTSMAARILRSAEGEQSAARATAAGSQKGTAKPKAAAKKAPAKAAAAKSAAKAPAKTAAKAKTPAKPAK